MVQRLFRIEESYRPSVVFTDQGDRLIAAKVRECALVIRSGPVDAVLHTDCRIPSLTDLGCKVGETDLVT